MSRLQAPVQTVRAPRHHRSTSIASPAFSRGRAHFACFFFACVFGLSGCGFVGFPGVYRIDIEQGNLVDQEMIEQLKPGMSRRQVRFIMGSPLVEDTFRSDRWDYPYVIRNGQTIIREAQVTILFEGDSLAEIRGDYLPEWARGEEEPAELGEGDLEDDESLAEEPEG